MKISVLVPTYHRPDDLVRCLEALASQTLGADEVLVVSRRGDAPTDAALDREIALQRLPIKRVQVDQPGVVAALNAGLVQATGELLAITDDDAAPHADWLARIHAHFLANPRLGGLGGRDWVHEKGRRLDGSRARVGKLQWIGRMVGNHHLGIGPSRRVDLLKGANMSFRLSAARQVRFDVRLRGNGAQVHNDMAFGLAVQRAGYELVYDPLVAVEHFPAPRYDEHGRIHVTRTALENSAYNLHLILLEHLPAPRRWVCWCWYALIGTEVDPGWLQLIRGVLLKRDRDTLSLWRAHRSGAWQALRDWRQAARSHAKPLREA